MNKFERLKSEMEAVGNGKMKAFGQSMLPILKSGLESHLPISLNRCR